MNKKFIMLTILFLLATYGCVSQEQEQDPKLQKFQDIGVLSFGPKTDKIPPGRYAYISLVIRNNLLGDMAGNVTASLDNVYPFRIVENGSEHGPDDIRSSGIPYYDGDLGLKYRQHRIINFFPDQEMEFFWILRAPNASEIANMWYEHPIYYTLDYDYKMNAYQEVIAMSESEYSYRRERNALPTPGAIISAGPISIIPATQQIVIFNPGEASSFIYSFDMKNIGKGMLKPGTNLTLGFNFSDKINCSAPNPQQEWSCSGKRCENKKITPEELAVGIRVGIPCDISQKNETFISLPFYFDITYEYTLEGNAKIVVAPLKVY
jgi:hypothetical protein